MFITKGYRMTAFKNNDYSITMVHAMNILRAPLRLSGYQMALCISGSVEMTVSGERVRYKTGNFATFSPFNTLEVLEVSPDYRCILLMFQKNFLTETLNNIYFLERFQLLRNTGIILMELSEAELLLFTARLHRLEGAMRDTTHLFARDIVRSKIIVLLYRLEELLLHRVNEVNNDLNPVGKEKKLADFQDLLTRYYYSERKVSFYAGLLNTTSAQLSKMLYEATGRKAKEHIDDIRLLEAMHLLKAGRYNVSEVSSLLYYKNVEEFSRFFKKKTGISPLRYARDQL